MTSPPVGGSEPHQRKNRPGWVVALAVVALAGALIALPCEAQSTGAPTASSDSARAAPPANAAIDSTAPGSATPDSAAPGRAATDTTAPDSAAPRPRPVPPPPAPVDSALGAACEETNGGPPDLLLVTFRSTTTASERSAVAQEIGGTILGMSQHAAPGAWYLQVPGSAGDRSVADRLIVLSPVLEVGATRCPS